MEHRHELGKECVFPTEVFDQFFFIYIDGTVSEWKRILDVNIIALSVCSREAVKSMNNRNLKDAHIIHLSRFK